MNRLYYIYIYIYIYIYPFSNFEEIEAHFIRFLNIQYYYYYYYITLLYYYIFLFYFETVKKVSLRDVAVYDDVGQTHIVGRISAAQRAQMVLHTHTHTHTQSVYVSRFSV